MNYEEQTALICQFLKTWRSSAGIPQRQVLVSTGIDVSNYENGRCIPGLKSVLALCDFYGISCRWLIGMTEDIMGGTMEIYEHSLIEGGYS